MMSCREPAGDLMREREWEWKEREERRVMCERVMSGFLVSEVRENVCDERNKE